MNNIYKGHFWETRLVSLAHPNLSVRCFRHFFSFYLKLTLLFPFAPVCVLYVFALFHLSLCIKVFIQALLCVSERETVRYTKLVYASEMNVFKRIFVHRFIIILSFQFSTFLLEKEIEKYEHFSGKEAKKYIQTEMR